MICEARPQLHCHSIAEDLLVCHWIRQCFDGPTVKPTSRLGGGLSDGTLYSISKTCQTCSDVACKQSDGRGVNSGSEGETSQHNSTPQDDRRTSLRSTAVAPPHSPRVVEEVLQDSTKEAQPLAVRVAGRRYSESRMDSTKRIEGACRLRNSVEPEGNHYPRFQAAAKRANA